MLFQSATVVVRLRERNMTVLSQMMTSIILIYIVYHTITAKLKIFQSESQKIVFLNLSNSTYRRDLLFLSNGSNFQYQWRVCINAFDRLLTHAQIFQTLKAHRQISEKRCFERIVHMIKHANFQLHRVHPDGVISKT